MRILTCIIFYIIPFWSFCQNVNNGIQLLNQANELINKNLYVDAVTFIDKSLKHNTEISDSIKAELYFGKFIAECDISKTENNFSARKNSIKLAIELYESLAKKDRNRMHSFYKMYLDLISPPHDLIGFTDYTDYTDYTEYYKYTLKLFKNNPFYASDYRLLYYLFEYPCSELNNEEECLYKVDSIAKNLSDQGLNIQYFSNYLKNIKANVICSSNIKLNNKSPFGRVNKKFERSAVSLNIECIKELSKYELTGPLELLLADCLNDLVPDLIDLNMFDIASIYMERYLKLVYKNWKKWGLNSPWANHEDNRNHYMYAYEQYMDCLESSNQYDLAISYTQNVLTEIDKYNMKNYTKFVKSCIERLKNLKEGKHLKSYYGAGMKNENMLDLYNSGNFEKLTFVADSIISSILNIFEKDGSLMDDYFENVEFTKDDDILFAKREMWWFANAATDYWESLWYKARIASIQGNKQLAIKYQEEVVDIVKIDYKYQPNLREELIHKQSFLSMQYISTEIFQHIFLAEYYFAARRNSEAIKCLRIAMNSSLDLLSSTIFGSDIAKSDLVNDSYIIMNEMLDVVVRNSDNCPESVDILIEINSIMKGLLQNEKIATQNAILGYIGSTTDKTSLKQHYKAKIELDRLIDQTYYTNQKKKRDDYIIERTLYQMQIDRKIDKMGIIKTLILNKNILNKRLQKGDLYIDILDLREVQDTTKYLFVDSLKNGLFVARECSRVITYAVIYRPEWEHARLIRLCDNVTEIGDGVGALSEYRNTNSKQIYQFYTSTAATNYIWGKILKKALVVEGANIYISASGVIASIAIEQMLLDDGRRICDKYNCYRLTSPLELERKYDNFSSDYNAALFYDMNYSWANSTQMLPSLRINLSRPHCGAIKNAMEKIFESKLKLFVDNNSTEQNFIALSGHSPSCLHVATHGFDKLNGELEPNEREYLLGQRLQFFNNKDESMFKTGLYMSSLSWNNNNSNDGLLTSHEISMLDLSNTKLCVLSACSTASGEASLDGIYGLQRAFKLAGVKTLLVSLWDVDDKATELLMSKFYENLSLKKSPIESLRKAQLYVKAFVDDNDYLNGLTNLYRYENPYYWAGFILLDAN